MALQRLQCNGKETTARPNMRGTNCCNNKFEIIQKTIAENHASAANIQKSLRLEIEDKFRKLESSLASKLDTILNKQEQIPCEIKSNWQTQHNLPPNKLKHIMKETLITQEKTKLISETGKLMKCSSISQ